MKILVDNARRDSHLEKIIRGNPHIKTLLNSACATGFKKILTMVYSQHRIKKSFVGGLK
ncbi:MAG: hypothetical protein WC412_08730 [Candidatus Omnitrophota bacterium]|jgi:hypothetical protein